MHNRHHQDAAISNTTAATSYHREVGCRCSAAAPTMSSGCVGPYVQSPACRRRSRARLVPFKRAGWSRPFRPQRHGLRSYGRRHLLALISDFLGDDLGFRLACHDEVASTRAPHRGRQSYQHVSARSSCRRAVSWRLLQTQSTTSAPSPPTRAPHRGRQSCRARSAHSS